ncbi:MAG: pitrilysin family protein [Minicystis sp.]
MKRTHLTFGAALFVLGSGCAGDPPPPPAVPEAPAPTTTATAAPAEPAREAPPPSGQAKPFRFPKVVWTELPNGLKVATVPSKALPVVQIRVVIPGGRAADGEKPGLASFTSTMLKDGGAGSMSSRDLVTRVESLGSDLSIDTSFDATVVGLAITRDRLGEAMDILGTVVTRPQMAPAELDKLKKRTIDRLADAARTSGSWGALMVLYRDLFALPSEQHPYATWSPTAADVQKISVADLRAFHKKFFVPKNAFVVVAGDTTPEAAKAAVAKAFGGWSGGEAPTLSFTDPNPPESRKITLVDRPKSSQSDVYVATFGPDRASKSWASFAVANQILGGGVSGRLFLDVREKQSLAYGTRSSVTELAHGPSVFSAYAGTQTAKTGLALRGLLDNLERLANTAPDASEVEIATRYLADSFSVKLETIGAVTNELVSLRVHGLPDDYDDAYRKEIGEITGPLALKAASDHLRPGHEVIVVAGDAAIIGPMLSHFGEVKVVDPTRDFARVRTIPMDPNAPLEVPRAEGK